MPLFEYTCAHCESQFELLMSTDTSGEQIHCPQCGSTSVQKRFSTFASRIGRSTAVAKNTPAACPTGTCCLNGSCGL